MQPLVFDLKLLPLTSCYRQMNNLKLWRFLTFVIISWSPADFLSIKTKNIHGNYQTGFNQMVSKVAKLSSSLVFCCYVCMLRAARTVYIHFHGTVTRPWDCPYAIATSALSSRFWRRLVNRGVQTLCYFFDSWTLGHDFVKLSLPKLQMLLYSRVLSTEL